MCVNFFFCEKMFTSNGVCCTNLAENINWKSFSLPRNLDRKILVSSSSSKIWKQVSPKVIKTGTIQSLVDLFFKKKERRVFENSRKIFENAPEVYVTITCITRDSLSGLPSFIQWSCTSVRCIRRTKSILRCIPGCKLLDLYFKII